MLVTTTLATSTRYARLLFRVQLGQTNPFLTSLVGLIREQRDYDQLSVALCTLDMDVENILGQSNITMSRSIVFWPKKQAITLVNTVMTGFHTSSPVSNLPSYPTSNSSYKSSDN